MQVRRILLRSAGALCAVGLAAAALIAFAPISGAHLARGLVYSLFGDQNRAIAAYDEAIRLDPDFAFAYARRGAAYGASFGQPSMDHAIADYDQAIRLAPKASLYAARGELHFYRGSIWDVAGDFDRVIGDY